MIGFVGMIVDLPTLKVCNMLEDYGDDPRDLYPMKFAGKPQHERSGVNILPIPKSSKSRWYKTNFNIIPNHTAIKQHQFQIAYIRIF